MKDTITVKKYAADLKGSVLIPGSKSITNRAIILAICSRGESTIRGPLYSDDTTCGVHAAKSLGCAVETSPDRIKINGIGRQRPVSNIAINVGSAGTIARFLPCLLAMGADGHWTLSASEQMTKRPMQGLFEALDRLGDPLTPLEKPNHYPLRVSGGKIRHYTTHVDGSISSQYMSGLLLAAPLAKAPVTIRTQGNIVQQQYVHITLDCMRAFGVEVGCNEDLSDITVTPAPYCAVDFTVEADASTASYFIALPGAVGGSICIENLSKESSQPDKRFVDIIKQFGCEVTWRDTKGVQVTRPPHLGKLRGGYCLNLNDCSDVALTAAALAPFADAPIDIIGVEHIRNHECDRISAMTAALRKLTVRVEERRDGWKIYPSTPVFADLKTQDDHRMAMALSVIGLGAEGVRLDDPDCVNKTCPTFFDLLQELGADLEPGPLR